MSGGPEVSKETLSVQERSRNIEELMQILMNINQINGGSSDTAERMKMHAKNFENAVYGKSSSRKEYVDSMKEKIQVMQGTLDEKRRSIVKDGAVGGVPGSVSSSSAVAAAAAAAAAASGAGQGVPSNATMNPQMFLNQQAQVRQQVAQQFRNQQQKTQGQPQPVANNQRPQLNPLQQQIVNQMKVAIIPKELLDRIPNLPPGVSTWQQITELAQRKMLSLHDMEAAKSIYKIHQQLLFKAKMQQVQQQQQQARNRVNSVSATPPVQPSSLAPNSSITSGTTSGGQGHVSGQITGQATAGTASAANSGNANPPNVLNQLNQIFSQDEQKQLLQEAIEACKNFQSTQYGNNMNDITKQNFIRKYINQKALRKLQEMRLSQQQQLRGRNNNSALDNTRSNNASVSPEMNTIPNSSSNNVGSSNPLYNSANNNPNPNMPTTHANIHNNNINNNTNNNSNALGTSNLPDGRSPNPKQSAQSASSSFLQSFSPTPRDIEVIKRISQEASKTSLRLTDLTATLSNQEKNEIKNKLRASQRLFIQVSNFAPQVYVITKSESFLKEVFQLRIFVKEILEKCAKGIYVVKLDTVDKLILKYQKYWESMKIQILRRQPNLQQHALQQQQQRQQQQSHGTQQATQHASQQAHQQNSQSQPQTHSQQQNSIGSMQQMQQQIQQQYQQRQSYQNQMSTSAAAAAMNPTAAVQGASTSSGFPKQPSVSSEVFSGKPSPVKPQSQIHGQQPRSGDVVQDMAKPIDSRNLSRAKTTPASTDISTVKNTPITAGPGAGASNMSTPAIPPKSIPLNANQQYFATVPTMNEPVAQHPYRSEELVLRDLNVRKNEIISRFRHRQELFEDSPMDIFLSTVADCLGVRDVNVEVIKKIPQSVEGLINGTGKKKLSKAAQKARENDVVNVLVKNGRLVMESKAMGTDRNYAIKPSFLASVFKQANPGAALKNLNMQGNGACGSVLSPGMVASDPFEVMQESKKRKFDILQISPTSNSNSDSSPASNIMSESKKIKIESPDDKFASKVPYFKSNLNTNSSVDNIWDWAYWENGS